MPYDSEREPSRKTDKDALIAAIKNPNLAESFEKTAEGKQLLAKIGAKVCEEFKIDETSRDEAGWTERNKRAMKLALQTKEVKSYPWPNAANVKYPLVAVAAIQFNARAYPAVIDGWNVVKGKALGKPSDEKTARAERVGKHMSYQLLQEMDGWEEGTDKLLVILPIVGTVFRKTYFDPSSGKNCSHLVTAEKLVMNYWSKDMQSCPRMTEVLSFYPDEIETKMRTGLWLRCELDPPSDKSDDDLAAREFLEQHRLWDLDGDGYPEPYIITVHRDTEKVVRIYARYDEDGVEGNDATGEVTRIKPVRCYTKYSFIPSPDGSIYDIGFGHLLDAINETINSTFNQLLDAGHLSNVQGGFIGGGVTLKSGSLRFSPGEWKRAESTGQELKNAIVPLPVQPPSPVLFSLLGMLIEASRDITSTKDILTGETQGQNQPVGTTLATIEQGLKVFTAIYKRVHRSLKDEFQALYRLNHLYLNPENYFAFEDDEMAVSQKDYANDIDVIPVSDPTIVTDMQRIARAQFAMQFVPLPFMNGPAIVDRALEAAGIQDRKALFAEQVPPDPKMLIEGGKLHNDDARVQIEQAKHDLAVKSYELEEKKVALLIAAQKANDTGTYAAALAALAGIGAGTTTTAPVLGPSKDGKPGKPIGEKKTTATNEGLPPHAAVALTHLHGLASSEVDLAQQEADAIQQDDVSGMEGQPPDGGVPGVPEGQPGPVGEPMGVGPADGAGAPGQGAPDVGAGDPGVG